MRQNPLKAWRKQNGIKAVEVALKLGLSEQSITSFEKGRFSPSKETFDKLAVLMNIQIETLRAAWHFWRAERSL